MSIGRFILKFRQKFGHGLSVAYYRDFIRPQILRTPPITGTVDRTSEIHVLTSAQDWLNLVWTLKSFYMMSNRCYSLCIHDDGSLVDNHLKTLAEHFPSARIITREAADVEMSKVLSSFPRCNRFRSNNPLAPKVFDFAYYLQADRMLLLDSDILFFSEPTELLRRIEDPTYQINSVNRDVASAYAVSPDVARTYCGVELVEQFNSGLGLIHKTSLDLRTVEEFLSIPGIIDGHFWRIEQTLYALCSSRFGVDLLPSEYNVKLEANLNDSVMRHYVGAIRHLAYSEGIARLQSILLKES